MPNQKQRDEQPPGSSLIIVHAETFKRAIAKNLTIFPEAKSTTITTASHLFPQWQNWDGAEIHIFPDRGWVNAIVSVEKVDSQSKTIYTNSQQNLLPGKPLFYYQYPRSFR